jgi:O-antigen ligase
VARPVLSPSVVNAARGGVDADTLLRSVLFVGVVLAVLISFHPFKSLAHPAAQVTEGGDITNQVAFSAIFLALAWWTSCHEPQRLKLLFRPVLFAMLAWFAVSVLASWDPSLAARRLAFAVVLMGISAMLLLLPKNVRHFSDLVTAVALIVIVASYLGVFLVPQLAIHQATDFLEPEHAGSWRGVFPHKNEAGATMVLFIFIGMFVARVRSFTLGSLIVVLAGMFLGFTQSKTAIGVLPLAFILSAIVPRSRRPSVAITLVIIILALFLLFSVGTVMFDPVRHLVQSFMPDATFTGRTEIWQIGIQAVAHRPLTGYGFSSFWGTEQVVYGLGENTSWANDATDAHNAYLNLAVTVGLPGLALAIVWVVILPILDYFRLPRGIAGGPLPMLFLRICLFGIYASCFESSIFQQVGEVWFLFMTSVFGLRYLSQTGVTV